MSFGEMRLERQGLFVARKRLFDASQAGQSHRKVEVGVRGVLFDFDGATEQPRRLGKPALLQANEPQTVNGLEVAVVGLENDFIRPFRVPQPPLGMQRSRLLKGLQRADVSRLSKRALSHGPRPAASAGDLAEPARFSADCAGRQARDSLAQARFCAVKSRSRCVTKLPSLPRFRCDGHGLVLDSQDGCGVRWPASAGPCYNA